MCQVFSPLGTWVHGDARHGHATHGGHDGPTGIDLGARGFTCKFFMDAKRFHRAFS
jgi:hypothetical protein